MEDAGTCPAANVLPQGPLWDTRAVLAAAREALAADAGRRGEIGAVLLHLLDHGINDRPLVAAAIVAEVPERIPAAAARLDGFLADRMSDPAVAGDIMRLELEMGDERIAVWTAVALLDPARRDEARRLFREAKPVDVPPTAAGFALLGSQEADEAAARLAELVRDTSTVAQASAIRALLDFGPRAHAPLRAALAELIAGGHVLRATGTFIRPVAATPPEFVAEAVALAVRALESDPGRYLGPHDDLALEVLECGPQHRDALARALLKVAENAAVSARVRRRAERLLAQVGHEEHARATAALSQAGVEDPDIAPETPVLDEEAAARVREQVADAWRRIEAQLRDRFPEFEVELGPPASAEEIAELEQLLGFTLPLDFAVSCGVHRSVRFGGSVDDMLSHGDLGTLAELRDAQDDSWSSDRPDTRIRMDWGWRPGWIPLQEEPDGSSHALDLDPATTGRYGQLIFLDQGIPSHITADSWLDLLAGFAAGLERGEFEYRREEGTIFRAVPAAPPEQSGHHTRSGQPARR